MNKLEDSKKHSQSVVYSGSSVIGLKYNKGIIIACDTRMCYGSSLSLVESNERIKALNNRTLIGYSGEYSDMQETSRILNELILEDNLETNGKNAMGPVELGHYLSSLHYERRNKLDPFLNFDFRYFSDDEFSLYLNCYYYKNYH